MPESVHDEHFLTRLERLEREHAELALGLYYDSALVRHILRVAKVPDDDDRVALCLGSPDDGPWVIVARDGHFVTCLAEGMQLREGQAVISRHRLDTISETVESLRTLLAESRAGGRRQITRTLERVFTAGSSLSQEEFENIARWLPLLTVDFLRSHMDLVERAHLLAEHLGRKKRVARRHEQALHQYWQATWAIAHLTMLLGSDNAVRLRKLLELFADDEPGIGLQMPWSLIRLGASSFAARGAWIASKLPTLIVPAAKRRLIVPEATTLTSLTDSLSLAAVGLRHRRYQAEVRKAFARAADPDSKTHAGAIRNFAEAWFESHLDSPEHYLAHTNDLARQFMRGIYAHLEQQYIDALDELSPDVGSSLLLSMPLGVMEGSDAIRSLFDWLPWIVSVEAKSFYAPEPFVAILQQPWTPEDGQFLLDARKSVGIQRASPARAAPKIGRNEPCPCGSGRKYKRCCGDPSNAANNN